jgi:low temperature requirement protein LtrA
VAAAIWWLYFDFLDSSMVARSVARGMTFVYAHYLIATGIAALGVGVKLAILSAAAGPRYDDAGWITAAGTAMCMAGLALIHLATPPGVVDADVALRLSTAAAGLVLVALTGVLSPVLVVWLLAVVLVAQVVVELARHEEHAAAAGARPAS